MCKLPSSIMLVFGKYNTVLFLRSHGDIPSRYINKTVVSYAAIQQNAIR
jgi:hypothetical protein